MRGPQAGRCQAKDGPALYIRSCIRPTPHIRQSIELRSVLFGSHNPEEWTLEFHSAQQLDRLTHTVTP